MTRVNVIEPVYLTNRHLLAEYKEITQFMHLAKKSDLIGLPDDYTLGKGHCKFFFDKGLFIRKRFELLGNELIKRNFAVKKELFHERIERIEKSFLVWKDYQPTSKAIKINVERIKQRIENKPQIYPDKDRFLTYVANLELDILD